LTLARNGGTVIWIGNSNPEVTINMQQIVTRELTVRGAYGFNREFSQAIEAIRFGKVDTQPLVEKITSLEEGSQIIQKLATGKLDYVKVLLKP
jgi:L-iditol 2-dehydrogenase